MSLSPYSGLGKVGQRVCELLAERGYALSPCTSESITLATKRGHSAGLFLPYTDFIFVVDLDAEHVTDGVSFEAMHERHRNYGEGQMKVPRALRYRVPNSITLGITKGPAVDSMIEIARKSRHKVNSGEKNSVYLLDLGSEMMYSQGWEHDPLKYAGTHVTQVNPSNRTFALITEVVAEALSPSAHDATAPEPDRPPMDPRLL